MSDQKHKKIKRLRVVFIITAAVIIGAALLFFIRPKNKDNFLYHNERTGQTITPLLSLSFKNTPVVQIETKKGDVYARVVVTPEERQRGLSGTTQLPRDQGVFFVFPDAGYHLFWMKDMLFPIDIIWLDRSMRVITIKENIAPETYPQTFSPRAPAQYVLELNAGAAKSFDIKEGDTLLISPSNQFFN